MVSIAEIQREALPAGTEVLAGERQLSREVGGVVVLRVRQPGLGAPRKDDLVLLATRTLQAIDPQLTLMRALQLIAAEVAAVAVQGDIPADAIQAAETRRLPLLRLPATASLSDVEHDVLRVLSEWRIEWYRRREWVLRELTALAVQGQGLDAVAERMGALSGQAVLFEGERGTPLALYFPPDFPTEHGDLVRAFVEGREVIPTALPADLNLGSFSHHGSGLTRLVAPVTVKDLPGVTVSLIGPKQAQDDHARLVLDAGATAASIELAREHAVRETVHRIQGDLVSRLIHGEEDNRSLEREAARAGYPLHARRVAIAVNPIPSASGSGDPFVLSALIRRANRVLTGYEVHAPIHVDKTLLTVFYPLEEDLATAALRRLAERLMRDLAIASLHHQLVAGVSRIHAGADSFRISFHEARRALELGQAIAPDRAVTSFEELGVYRLLLAIPDHWELKEFCGTMLGTLAAYDRDKNAELIPTLDAYLRGKNATEVAGRLSLHRNTLLYRLRRIREITGLDLDDPETRFTLQLALRAADALKAANEMER